MNATVWSLVDLEIIGYADDRDQSMLPAIVPPVYRSISDPGVVLVPPYTIHFDRVSGATQLPFSEAESLRDRGELTFFLESILAAKNGHQLWLRRTGEVIYQPEPEARRERQQLSGRAVQRAVVALEAHDLDTAEAAASEAILCDDRRVEPFAIKAAIRRIRGNSAGERVMAELTNDLIDSVAFGSLVNHYCSCISARPPKPPSHACVMAGIATFPARAIAA